MTQNINGIDLSMRFGGDDTCFLFNLTQNMRFDTLKNTQDLQGDAVVYAQTTTAFDDEEEDMSENDMSYQSQSNNGGDRTDQDNEGNSDSDADDDIDRESQ